MPKKLKFKVINEEQYQEKEIEVTVRIGSAGHVLLSLNNIPVAYIDCEDGVLSTMTLYNKEIKELNKLGINTKNDYILTKKGD